MKRKQKLKVDKILVIFIIVGIVLFGFLGFKAYNDFFVDKTPNKKLMSLDLYGYTLAKNDTSLYKDNFKELEAVLNEKPINYHSYAKLLAKLFVIDVYTLDNKLASTDIGGLEFVHNDFKANFSEYLGSSLYNHILSNCFILSAILRTLKTKIYVQRIYLDCKKKLRVLYSCCYGKERLQDC